MSKATRFLAAAMLVMGAGSAGACDATPLICFGDSYRHCECPGGGKGEARCGQDGTTWEACVCGGSSPGVGGGGGANGAAGAGGAGGTGGAGSSSGDGFDAGCMQSKICAQVQCGVYEDLCGTVDCGSCSPGKVCNGGMCCKPATCTTGACGVSLDGCGAIVSCPLQSANPELFCGPNGRWLCTDASRHPIAKQYCTFDPNISQPSFCGDVGAPDVPPSCKDMATDIEGKRLWCCPKNPT
jgi:hypothetical protein